MNDDIKYHKNKDTDERRIIIIKIMNKFAKNQLEFDEENLDLTIDEIVTEIVLPRIKKLVDENTFDFDSILTNSEKHRLL